MHNTNLENPFEAAISPMISSPQGHGSTSDTRQSPFQETTTLASDYERIPQLRASPSPNAQNTPETETPEAPILTNSSQRSQLSPRSKDIVRTTPMSQAKEAIEDDEPVNPIDFVRLEQKEVDISILESLASEWRNGIPCQCLSDNEAGGFNMVFFLEFADGEVWVARLPALAGAVRPLHDPLAQECTLSMIVTHEYLAEKTTIPVPRIYGYDLTCNNALQTPYVFMSKVDGVLLSDLLEDGAIYDDEIMERIVKEWGRYVVELAGIHFPAIGSLRRNDQGEYEVGPLITPWMFGVENEFEHAINRGPFSSVIDYLLSRSTVKRYLDNPTKPTFGGHLRMSLVDSFISYFVDLRYVHGPFVLSHIDLDITNIMVDPGSGKITGIIDWDFAAILPIQSHIALSEILNAEFLPASEFENRSDGYDQILRFSKRFRGVYEQAIIDAAGESCADFQADELLDRSLMYGLFEKALSYMPNERYLPALWHHVYGGGLESVEKVRNGMRKGYWAAWMAEKWKVEVKTRKSRQTEEPHTEKVVESPLVGAVSLSPLRRKGTEPLVEEVPIIRPDNAPLVEEIPIPQEERRSQSLVPVVPVVPIHPAPQQPARQGMFAATIRRWKSGRDVWFDWVQTRQKSLVQIVEDRQKRLKREATLEKLQSNDPPKKRSLVKSVFFCC